MTHPFHSPVIHRVLCANLPRGVYYWALADGSPIVFAIDPRSKLLAIGAPSAAGIAGLWRLLNAVDPRPRSEERVGDLRRKRRAPLIPDLALVR